MRKSILLSAINAKTLKVDFNKVIAEEDQAKATIAVKRGTSTVNLEADWAEDGKSVELSRTTNLQAGEYTVTISGLVEEDLTGSVEVEAQKAVSITLGTMVEVDNPTAELGYTVLDQYGEEMVAAPNKFTWTVTNKTNSTRSVTVANAASTSDKVLKLDTQTNSAELKDELLVTAVLKADAAVMATGTVTVVEITAGEFTLGEVVLDEDTPRLTQGAGYVEVSYELFDNHGKKKNLSAVATNENTNTVDGITFVSSDTTIIPIANDTNKNFKVSAKGVLEFFVEDKAGDVTLTAINANTGETSSIKIKVNTATSVRTIEFGELNEILVKGDAKGTALLPVKFFDQYEEEVTKTVADNKAVTNVFALTVTGPSSAAATALDPTLLVDGNDRYIEFNTAAAGLEDGDYTIRYTHKETGKQFVTNVTVNKARVPSRLEVQQAPALELAQGASTTVKFAVYDQYDKQMKENVSNYEIAIAKATEADAILTAPAQGTTNVEISNALAGITITANSTNKGSETLTFTFKNTSTDEEIGQVEYKFNVLDADGIVSYAAEELDTLYAPHADLAAANVFLVAHGADKYDLDIDVYGLNAQGKKVALTTTQKDNFTYVSQDLTIAETDGKAVKGLKVGSTVIDVYDGTKKITSVNVTVSESLPKVVSITVPATASVAKQTSGDSGVELVIKDQYGVDLVADQVITDFADANVAVLTSDATILKATNVKLDSGKLILESEDKAGTVDVIFTIGDITKTLTLTVTSS